MAFVEDDATVDASGQHTLLPIICDQQMLFGTDTTLSVPRTFLHPLALTFLYPYNPLHDALGACKFISSALCVCMWVCACRDVALCV